MASESEIVEIEGSYGEGGGQVLRNSCSLAALLSKSLHIRNIRAGRDNPGLRPQHLAGLQFVTRLAGGNLDGGVVGSREVTFQPQYIQQGSFTCDCGTAGATTLMVQIALPVMLFAPAAVTAELKGGTNVSHSPPIDEMLMVFAPLVRRILGLKFDLQIVKRGFYPKGGGLVRLSVQEPILSHPLPAFELMDRGVVTHVEGYVLEYGGKGKDVSEKMINTARKQLNAYFSGQRVSLDFSVKTSEPGHGTYTGIFLIAHTSTGCIFGASATVERGVSANDAANHAVLHLIKNLNEGGCVDEYVQDQLIIFMALAKGTSRLRTGPLTLHTTTSIHFCGLLTGAEFEVTKSSDSAAHSSASASSSSDESYIITCKGIGYTNRYASPEDDQELGDKRELASAASSSKQAEEQEEEPRSPKMARMKD